MVSSAFRPPAAYRDMSSGEMIADGAVHPRRRWSPASSAFPLLFQKVALRGAASDGVAMANLRRRLPEISFSGTRRR